MRGVALLFVQLAQRHQAIGASTGVGLGLGGAGQRRRRFIEPAVGALQLREIEQRQPIAVGGRDLQRRARRREVVLPRAQDAEPPRQRLLERAGRQEIDQPRVRVEIVGDTGRAHGHAQQAPRRCRRRGVDVERLFEASDGVGHAIGRFVEAAALDEQRRARRRVDGVAERRRPLAERRRRIVVAARGRQIDEAGQRAEIAGLLGQDGAVGRARGLFFAGGQRQLGLDPDQAALLGRGCGGDLAIDDRQQRRIALPFEDAQPEPAQAAQRVSVLGIGVQRRLVALERVGDVAQPLGRAAGREREPRNPGRVVRRRQQPLGVVQRQLIAQVGRIERLRRRQLGHHQRRQRRGRRDDARGHDRTRLDRRQRQRWSDHLRRLRRLGVAVGDGQRRTIGIGRAGADVERHRRLDQRSKAPRRRPSPPERSEPPA